jgi:hypothetical protein
VLFDPDIVIEIFFFDRVAEPEQIRETAYAQLGDRASGEVSRDDVPDDGPPGDQDDDGDRG